MELVDSGTCDDGHMDIERSDVPPRRSILPAKLTGNPATDRALLELADVLAEIARDVVCRSAEEQESQSSEGKHDDR